MRKDRTLSSVTVSTSYQYDLLGRLIGITDNAGNHWTYVYDSLGRRTDATDPDLGHWTYQYDPAGQLTDQTDAKSQVTHFTYDGTGRVLTKTALFGTAQPAATTYTYDEARTGFFNVGHLTTAANAAETMQYNFDAAGHQLQEIHIVASTTYTTTTTYDAGGRLTSRQYPDGDSVGSVSTPIGYDGAGRLTSVPGILSSVTYTARDQQAIVTRANSTTTTYGYSTQRGWLTGITTTVGASTILGLTYSRDTHGRINGVTSTPAGASYTYGYDDFDRLLSADNTTDNTFDQTFTYDSVDNMLTNSLVGPYTYPAPGTARPHGVTNAGGQPYGYDANGSMTSAAGDTLTYDGENRLASDNGVQFVYGADGNRLKKISGSTTTLYLSADVELTGSQYTKYLPGDALRQGTTTYWLHRDNLNSVRMLSNSSSGVVETGQYRPYGERQGFAGPVAESRGYIGERHDDETGLMYLNARYYDPVLGRFIQADPTTPLLKGVGINRYAYTSNNPITRMDPTGLADSGCDFSGCGVFGPIGSGASLLNLGSIGSVGLAGAAADVLPIEEAPVAASTLEAGSGVGAGATAVVETGGVIVVVCILICPSTAQAPEGDKNGPKAVLPPPVLSQSQSDSGQKSNSGAQTNASTAAATQTKDVRLIIIDYNDYPTVAEHILKAQAAGQPIVLTYDPEGADARRSAATGGLPKVPGFHWDEYPPAAFLEGGVGASVELVHEQDNWGSGGSMAAQMRGAEAGDLFVIEVWKDPE